jgi:hypothetical protein
VAGLYRGALWFVEAFVVHDWNSLFFPAYNYVASGPAFYAVRVASALLSLGVVATMTRRRPDRLPPPPEEEPEPPLV